MSKKISKVVNWLTELGFDLRISNTDYVNYTDKFICINAVQSTKSKLFSLLHECGHVILFKKSTYSKDYKAIDMARMDGRSSRSDVFKYKKLREEIEAWEHGYILAKELGIKINKEEYDKFASKCFKSYIKFYA